MTEEEFRLDFENKIHSIFNVSRELSPIKTGNLRYNAMQIMKTPTGYKIWVDLSKAEYAEYLDTKPKVQREHPQGWFNEIALDMIERIKKEYS